jgi:hypothetical protein
MLQPVSGRFLKRSGRVALTLGVIALLWQLPALLILAVVCPTLECDPFGIVLILAEPILGAVALGIAILAKVRRVEQPDRGLAIAGAVIGVFVVLKWIFGFLNS